MSGLWKVNSFLNLHHLRWTHGWILLSPHFTTQSSTEILSSSPYQVYLPLCISWQHMLAQSTSRICQLSLPGFLCAIHGTIWNYSYSLLSLEEHQHSVVLPQSNALPLWHSYVPLSHISCLDFIPLWCKECLGGCHCPELQKGVEYKSSASESPNSPESYLLFLWILIPGWGRTCKHLSQ